MTSMLNVTGQEVETDVYLSEQLKVISAFTISALQTGPEQNELTQIQQQCLHAVRYYGTDAREQALHVIQNPIVYYLQQHWMQTYAPIVGVIVRIDQQPLEPTLRVVEGYQQKVIQNIGSLRYLWHQKAEQILPLQSALEQIRWNGPFVEFIPEFSDESESPGEYYLAKDALLPHVCVDDAGPSIQFDSEHIDPETLRIAINSAHKEGIEKDLANYV